MRKIWLAIVTILFTFALVACTNDNSPQTSDNLPESSPAPESSVPPSDENSEWEDIEFPRP